MASVQPPVDATDFALRAAYVILNSGLSWTVAHGIWARVRPALLATGSVGETFHHIHKKRAIDEVMADRDRWFGEFQLAWREGPIETISFCRTLPFIGETTKYHLAKNLGVDCAKPDVWLVRVAAATGEDPHALCARLADASGDRVSVVDYVIWRACQQGFWSGLAPPSNA